MKPRRRLPPRRNGTGRHRAAPSAWVITGRTIAGTVAVVLLGSGVYVYVVQEKAIREGYEPPIALPRIVAPAPVLAISLPEPEPLTVSVAAVDDVSPERPSAVDAPPPQPAAEGSQRPGPVAGPDPAPVVAAPPVPGAKLKKPKLEPPEIQIVEIPDVDMPVDAVDNSCSISNVGKDVRPHVRAVGCFLAEEFPEVDAILGRRPDGATDDHPDGVALDLMVGKDSELGDAIADCAAANFSEWSIANIIWQQAIKTSGRGRFRPMEDRGGATANHRDHVHLSFKRGAPPPDELEC